MKPTSGDVTRRTTSAAPMKPSPIRDRRGARMKISRMPPSGPASKGCSIGGSLSRSAARGNDRSQRGQRGRRQQGDARQEERAVQGGYELRPMADAIPAWATPTADMAIEVVAVPQSPMPVPTSPRFHQIAPMPVSVPSRSRPRVAAPLTASRREEGAGPVEAGRRGGSLAARDEARSCVTLVQPPRDRACLEGMQLEMTPTVAARVRQVDWPALIEEVDDFGCGLTPRI